MNTNRRRADRAKSGGRLQLLLAVIGCGGMFVRNTGYAQTEESLAGESAAQALKNSIESEPYNQNYGPVRVRTSAGVGVNYTDNVFYSYYPKADIMIEPEAELDALWPVSELNTVRLSLGLSYEWYLENPVLNSDAPLVNPGSELAFNLFVGDFRIQPHEQFSYQQSLFFNSFSGAGPFYNFNNVGTFSRLDNQVGVDVTWSLEKAVLKAGYNHENFISKTAEFDYLDRSSEWFTAAAGYVLGDHVQAGPEGWLSLHNYDQQTILTDNWRGRIGPFVEATFPEKITLRVGVGYDMAQYNSTSVPASVGGPGILLGNASNAYDSDYSSYYAYAKISQEMRLFTHSLEAGRDLLLGANANNLRTVYAKYSISSPIIRNVELGANASVNVAEEYGGPSGFDEQFTYYGVGLQMRYQFAKHWRTDLGYEFLLKESDLPLRDFNRNQVNLDVVWSF
ncbi:MAG: hypothetical protein ACREDQ_02935 [Limisphaerales bacterium]